MTAKLTLTVEATVIAKAKRIAKRKKLSLSRVVTKALEEMVREEELAEQHTAKYDSTVSSLIGSLPLPADFNPDDVRLAYLKQKHA